MDHFGLSSLVGLSVLLCSIHGFPSGHLYWKEEKMNAKWTFSALVLVALSAGAAAASPDDDAWEP